MTDGKKTVNWERRKRLLFSQAGLALAVGTLAAANLLAHFAYARLDVSAGRMYSLSPGSKAVLGRLKEPLIIRAYFTPRLPPPYGLTEEYLRDLLAEYKSAGRGRVRVEFVDPDGGEARRSEAVAAGVVPFQAQLLARDKFEAKEAFMGVVFLYAGKTDVMPIVEDAENLEYAVTRRVKRLVEPELKTVGFVSGHGEKTPDDPSLRPLFQLVHERMKTVEIALDKPLPPGLSALWVVEPDRRFKPAELAALRDWVASGGTLGVYAGRRLVDFSGFRTSPLATGLEDLLKGWGLDLREGLVVDAQCENIQMQTQYGQFTAMRLQEYPFMPISKRLDADNPATRALDAVTFPFAHPLVFRGAPGVKYSSLADSSRLSWYQTTDLVSPSQPLEKLESAEQGPFSLAGVLDAGKGRVVVVGSRYFVDSRLINKATTVGFVLNLLDWALQDQDLLSIRAKGAAYRPLRRLTDAERFTVKYLMILFLPASLLALGLWSWSRQRARLAALPAEYADA